MRPTDSKAPRSQPPPQVVVQLHSPPAGPEKRPPWRVIGLAAFGLVIAGTVAAATVYGEKTGDFLPLKALATAGLDLLKVVKP